MPTNIVTPQAVKLSTAVCTAAKITYNDVTNAVTLLTAGASGEVIYKLTALARANVTATECQLYRYDGSNYFFIASATMPLHTKVQTAAQTPVDFGFTETAPLRVKAADVLLVALGVPCAGGVVFTAQHESIV